LKLENEPTKMVQALQEALNLSVPPIKIEGFDISHIQGNLQLHQWYFLKMADRKRVNIADIKLNQLIDRTIMRV